MPKPIVTYAFIATHDQRIQCLFNKLITTTTTKQKETTIEKEPSKRFKNCAIIHIKSENNKLIFNMIYEGTIDGEKEDLKLFWTIADFNNYSKSINSPSTNKHIEIFIIRHGQGIHNIEHTKRVIMALKNIAQIPIKGTKKLNEAHEFIDAELTHDGILSAIEAGKQLHKFLNNKILLTMENVILGASKLRRTRQTISYLMNEVLKSFKFSISKLKIYIFPCVYEVATVDKKGNCEEYSFNRKLRKQLAYENKPKCISIDDISSDDSENIINNPTCEKIAIEKSYPEIAIEKSDAKNANDTCDTKTCIPIDWTRASIKQKLMTYDCNNMLDSCYLIINLIIESLNTQKFEILHKQKYLKYKIKYLKLKQILNN